MTRVGAVPVHWLDQWWGEPARWGDPSRYVAVSADVLWLVSGDNALGTLKQLVKAPARETPALEMTLSILRIHLPQDTKQAARLYRRVYGSAKEPRDRTWATIEGGPVLKLRVATHLEVVKYMQCLEEPEKAKKKP